MAKPAPPRSYGWQGDEPTRTCALCGEHIVLKGNSVWFRRYPVIETWHFSCPWRERRVAA